MSLIPYTITALEASAVDSATSGKNIVVGAVVTMTDSAGVVTMFDDAAGSNGSTAKATGADGQVTVFVNPNTYTISVNGSVSKVEISEAEFTGTTTDLINSIDAYAADTLINSTGCIFSGDGGAGSWVQNGVTGQTASQSPAQLGNALLNDASGNQWSLVSKPVNVKMLGAVGLVESGGASARLAVQAAINSFKNPDLTGLPGATSFRDRLVYGRVLDLDGDQYFIDTHLDYSLAHGILIQNGTLVATTDGTWNAGEALLQNQSDFCINPMFSDIVIECNGVTNGIFLERGVYGVLDNVRVYGWFEQDYAIKAGSNTTGFTTNIHFNNLKLWGTIAAETINTPTATATALIITDSDWPRWCRY